MRKIWFIISLFSLCLTIEAQTYSTRIFQPQVRTLRIQTLEAWEKKQAGEHVDPIRPILVLDASNPIIDGSDAANTLEISFDELSHEQHFYTYTLLHLDADWTPSALTSSEYLQGFTTMDITDIESSVNTSQPYTHYRFTFPNEDMRLSTSGNYAIRIYEDNNPDKLVATACFRVVEPIVSMQACVRANTNIEYNGRYQQLDIDIHTQPLDLRDPSEVKLVVVQNNRTDNCVFNPRPSYVEPGKLRYIDHSGLIFEGGNEYHHFDIYSTYFAGAGVDRVLHDRVDYHAFLWTDEIRANTPYAHEYDVNGQQLINAERTDYDDTEAEYMWVHWILPVEHPWMEGILYVGGDLFYNRMTADNRMQYDAENKCYWLTSLVKQGGADYQYWFLRKGEKTATTQRVDGSHWETRNEYIAYVYYRPFSGRADRLVGIMAIK